MTKKVAIVQSNYIPWKGYFDIINKADLFIFYDDVQFTKNDWRNRNRIKTPREVIWLTIPCGARISRLIHEVEIKDFSWQKRHWKSITQNYEKAPFFRLYKEFLEDFYLRKKWLNLSELNQYLIKHIARHFLNIKTVIDDSRNYALSKKKGERVLELLKRVNAAEYISGPSARNYLDESLFRKEGIVLTWMDYSGYPEYPQLYGDFVHEVSIIDLIFNVGPEATKYMKSFQTDD